MDMTYRLEFSQAFDNDLSLIHERLKSYPQKSRRLLEKLAEKITSLVLMPYMYQVFELFPQYRRIVIEDYIALYTVDDANETLLFQRMLPAKMDFEHMFL